MLKTHLMMLCIENPELSPTTYIHDFFVSFKLYRFMMFCTFLTGSA